MNLYNAVTVIRNLSFIGENDSSKYTETEINNIVDQKVQSAMLALSRGECYYFEGSDSKKQEQYERSGQPSRNNNRSQLRKRSGNKRSSSDPFCYDCGDANHLSGSSECKSPSFLTKKRRSERIGAEPKNQPSNQSKKVNWPDGENHQEEASNFRQGSNPMKRNHA